VRNVPNVVWLAGGGGGVYYIYHLERTETGRLRFMDVTEASERSMGDQAAQEILQQYSGKLLPENHPTTRYVRKVADRILTASGLDTQTHGQGALADVSDAWKSLGRKQGIDWKVHVIKDDSTKNAFVLPNGSIFVFVGS
jgi:predicted Zn-dependent protease